LSEDKFVLRELQQLPILIVKIYGDVSYMKTLIKLLLVLLLLAGGGYYWLSSKQALPDWYLEGEAVETTLPAEEAAERVEQVQEQLRTEQKVEIAESDISTMLREKINTQFGEQSDELIKGLKSSIKPDKVALEMVIDAEKIPWDDLPKSYEYARPFIAQLSALSDGNLFVSASGRPRLNEEGQLTFDDQATIQLGVFEYSLKDAVDMLESSGQRQILDMLSNLPFRDITLGNGVMVFER